MPFIFSLKLNLISNSGKVVLVVINVLFCFSGNGFIFSSFWRTYFPGKVFFVGSFLFCFVLFFIQHFDFIMLLFLDLQNFFWEIYCTLMEFLLYNIIFFSLLLWTFSLSLIFDSLINISPWIFERVESILDLWASEIPECQYLSSDLGSVQPFFFG